jgi:hypothetical protein
LFLYYTFLLILTLKLRNKILIYLYWVGAFFALDKFILMLNHTLIFKQSIFVYFLDYSGIVDNFILILMFFLIIVCNYYNLYNNYNLLILYIFIYILYDYSIKFNSILFINLNTTFTNNQLLNGLFIIHPLCMLFVYFIIFLINKVTNGLLLFKHYFYFDILRYYNKLNFLLIFTYITLVAILLGSWWALQELIWLLWWSWDPIELINISLTFQLLYFTHLLRIKLLPLFFNFFLRLFMFFIFVYSLSLRLGLFQSLHSFSTITVDSLFVFYILFFIIVLLCIFYKLNLFYYVTVFNLFLSFNWIVFFIFSIRLLIIGILFLIIQFNIDYFYIIDSWSYIYLYNIYYCVYQNFIYLLIVLPLTLIEFLILSLMKGLRFLNFFNKIFNHFFFLCIYMYAMIHSNDCLLYQYLINKLTFLTFIFINNLDYMFIEYYLVPCFFVASYTFTIILLNTFSYFKFSFLKYDFELFSFFNLYNSVLFIFIIYFFHSVVINISILYFINYLINYFYVYIYCTNKTYTL